MDLTESQLATMLFFSILINVLMIGASTYMHYRIKRRLDQIVGPEPDKANESLAGK